MSDNDNNNVQQFTVQDMVNYAMKKDAANLSTAFNSVIGSKVIDAIQQKKIDIAKKIMNPDAVPDITPESGEENSDNTQAVATETEPEKEEELVATETTTTGETNDEVAQQNT